MKSKHGIIVAQKKGAKAPFSYQCDLGIKD